MLPTGWCKFVIFIGMGLYTGVVPLMAFAYSAGDQKRLGQVLKTTAIYLTGITLGVAGFLFYSGNKYLASLARIPES